MLKKRNIFLVTFTTIIYSVLCNLLPIIDGHYWILIPMAVVCIFVNIWAGSNNNFVRTKRLNICNHGVVCLKSFCISMVISIIAHIVYAVIILPDHWALFLFSLLNSYILLLILFWNGIISIYTTSTQLGIKYRVIGIVLGMIPVANLFCLRKLINICEYEIVLESEKFDLNESRKDKQVCKTKYPILLVHGVFFRDTKMFNYWGRIPKELENNGATIFYGNHSSALPVERSALELKERIEEIIDQTGCEKVNIIAHSKGGLDCRVVLDTDAASKIASLTTINTPHFGCEFADYLLDLANESIKDKVSAAYNFTAAKLGDRNPDFISAVADLTHTNCSKFNETHASKPEVFCQSFGSVLKGATSPRFPLNLTYKFVKKFDGDHDGLVSVDAFEFGEKYTLIKPVGKRGISHADVIDLNRENIPGFDVREFYVGIVSDLKDRGF